MTYLIFIDSLRFRGCATPKSMIKPERQANEDVPALRGSQWASLSAAKGLVVLADQCGGPGTRIYCDVTDEAADSRYVPSSADETVVQKLCFYRRDLDECVTVPDRHTPTGVPGCAGMCARATPLASCAPDPPYQTPPHTLCVMCATPFPIYSTDFSPSLFPTTYPICAPALDALLLCVN